MNNLQFIRTNFGVASNEDNFMDVLFSMDTLIFLGILALLAWGLFTYLRNRKGEERADHRFENDLNDIDEPEADHSLENDREYVQAKLREEEFEEFFHPNDDTFNPKNHE